MDEPPSAVTPRASKQDGEVRDRWSWVEPCVWTDRMLTALEKGVKGGKWFSLVDKVYAPATLESAFAKVKANDGAPGVDRQTVKMFGQRLDEQLTRLSDDLRQGRYEPRPVRRTWIDKPGRRGEKRPLGIPTVRDRVVQTALRSVIEPIFEREFAEHSYGFRPGRGCKDALRRVDGLLEEGYTWIVDADLKSYFDTIPHEALMTRIEQHVSDGRVLSLIRSYLAQDVMDGLDRWSPESGTPQGAVISPLLSNVYLDPLDHLMAESGFEMTRYADDFVVQCRSRSEAQRALALIGRWCAAHELSLHPDKTTVVDATSKEGFVFLGYRFAAGRRWPSRKSQGKLKDTLRRPTKRCNGHSMRTIIEQINPTLRGWFEYFQHADPVAFNPLDGWVRMRLRSILRKRRGGRGRGRGDDHHRWPNAYFSSLGLYSMHKARSLARQPALR